jgi:hypothetical protein
MFLVIKIKTRTKMMIKKMRTPLLMMMRLVVVVAEIVNFRRLRTKETKKGESSRD